MANLKKKLELAKYMSEFEVREKEGAPVFFVPEPNNSYDSDAISIRTESGDVLGYIGRNDENRERVRRALSDGFVVARALKVGGFTQYNGSKASFGLRIQWYKVDAMYGWEQCKDEDEEVIASVRSNSKQKRKSYTVAIKYKGKEARKQLALGNVERDRGLMRKAGNSTRRAAFKRGEDIKPNHLREDSRYYHFIECGTWEPFNDGFKMPYYKETAPRKNKYISEAEALEMLERRSA